ncbi:MAG: polysaccharide pyruvyl transferase family protein, partial [Eubacterium sp.]|nr:polysaccharide pyruvyl transferase family protein [Eubacterium sp.]
MYTYGDSLPEIRLPELTPASRVSYNMKSELSDQVYEFIRKESRRFDHSVFVSQVLWEIHNFFIGYPNVKAKSPDFPSDYPLHFSDPLMSNTRMVGFLEQPSWINFLSGMDFNFGSRIHGNIVSLLAGTPCYIIASDSRVAELASYHNIPHISYLDLKEDTTIFDLYEKADYSKFYLGHSERVDHYLDLYDRNNIPHISRQMLNGSDTPFDRFIQSEKTFGVIRPFPELDLKEQEERMAEYAMAHFNRFDSFRVLKNTEINTKNTLINENNALIR